MKKNMYFCPINRVELLKWAALETIARLNKKKGTSEVWRAKTTVFNSLLVERMLLLLCGCRMMGEVGKWAEPTHLEHVGGAVVSVLHHHGLGPGQRVGDAVLLLVADGLQRRTSDAVSSPPPPSISLQLEGWEGFSPWPPAACRTSAPCWAARRWPCSCGTERSGSSACPCPRWAASHYTCRGREGIGWR